MSAVKIIILLTFLAILSSLAVGFFGLMKPKPDTKDRTVKALTVRVSLSITLLLAIAVLFHLGYLTPNT